MSTTRLQDIDCAKGLAITLVVAGHIVAGAPPADNEWYTVFKQSVYLFHMPFFMFLSGLVMGHCYRPVTSWIDYRRYVWGKFVRLVPAYLLFGLVVLIGKLAVSQFMFVDNAPEGLLKGLFNMLCYPTASAGRSLWYIYVLFAYYLAYPGFMMLTGGRPIRLLPIALVLYFVPLSSLFLANGIGQYLPFVLLGAWAGQDYPKYAAAVDRNVTLTVSLFLAYVVVFMLPDRVHPGPATIANAPKLALGLLSIPAIHGLIRMALGSHSKWLLTLGTYTFPIYLLNTITIGLTKGIMLKLLPWDGLNFLVYVPILMAGGLVLPILIRERLFAKIPALYAITK